MKWRECDIALALTRTGAPFSFRKWIVVENVSWGWGLTWEADLIAVSKSRYATEIEIKVNKYDLRHDRDKRKHHRSSFGKIKALYYAVPSELISDAMNPEIVDPKYGIIEVCEPKISYDHPTCKIIRRAVFDKKARELSKDEIHTLTKLAMYRYWDRPQWRKK